MKNLDKLPDPRLHQLVSFIKSGVRLLGYIFIPFDPFYSYGDIIS